MAEPEGSNSWGEVACQLIVNVVLGFTSRIIKISIFDNEGDSLFTKSLHFMDG